MILLAFHISRSINTKGHEGSEKKTNSNYIQIFKIQMHQFGLKK